MNKLIFISVHPIHYNDFLFHEIDKSGIDITVYYANKVLHNYPWKTKLNYTFPYKDCHYTLGIDWELLGKAVFSRNTTFMIAGWDSFFKNILFLAFIIFRKRYIITSDTVKPHLKRHWLKGAVRKLWLDIILGNAYKILTTGDVGVRAMASIYKKETDKIINFPFTTDLNYFNTVPDFSNFKDEKIIFSSGRLLNSHKGHDVAIKALSLLKNKGYNFKYLIAGTGPDEEMLKNLIKELDMESCVTLLGWQEISGVKELYSKTHIFLHPAHFDPFPNAVLEAMASSLIVVASDKSGSAVERVTDKVSGFIFKDNDIDGLAVLLAEIFDLDASALAEISSAANQVSKKWDVSYNLKIVKEVL